MGLKIVQKLIPESRYNWKSHTTMKPIGICVHNTANEASAVNEVAYMTRIDKKVSYHYAVDDIQVVQALPENRTGWHAGDNLGQGNMKHIGIEICYSLAKKLPEKEVYAKFDKAEKNAVLLIVQILKRYGWTTKNIKRHYDFSGKDCPHRTMDLGWNRFLKMVENEMIDKPKFKKGTHIKLSRSWDLFWGSGASAGRASKNSVCEVISDKYGSLPESAGDGPFLNVKFEDRSAYLRETQYLSETSEEITKMNPIIESTEDQQEGEGSEGTQNEQNNEGGSNDTTDETNDGSGDSVDSGEVNNDGGEDGDTSNSSDAGNFSIESVVRSIIDFIISLFKRN